MTTQSSAGPGSCVASERVAARRDRNRCCGEMREIEKPIVFIGVGRSGTTVVYDTFAARGDLAWFSQYLNRLPHCRR